MVLVVFRAKGSTASTTPKDFDINSSYHMQHLKAFCMKIWNIPDESSVQLQLSNGMNVWSLKQIYPKSPPPVIVLLVRMTGLVEVVITNLRCDQTRSVFVPRESSADELHRSIKAALRLPACIDVSTESLSLSPSAPAVLRVSHAGTFSVTVTLSSVSKEIKCPFNDSRSAFLALIARCSLGLFGVKIKPSRMVFTDQDSFQIISKDIKQVSKNARLILSLDALIIVRVRRRGSAVESSIPVLLDETILWDTALVELAHAAELIPRPSNKRGSDGDSRDGVLVGGGIRVVKEDSSELRCMDELSMWDELTVWR